MNLMWIKHSSAITARGMETVYRHRNAVWDNIYENIFWAQYVVETVIILAKGVEKNDTDFWALS